MTANFNYDFDYLEQWDIFVRTGDAGSLATVYNHFYDLMLNYGLRYCQDSQTIKDAIHNVFLNIIRSQKLMRKVENPAAYLLSCIKHEVFLLLAKRKREKINFNISNLEFKAEYSIEDELISKEYDEELKNTLARSLKNLTPSQKEILFLRYDMGLSYKDISCILNIKPESCRISIHRTLNAIRKEVETLKKKSRNNSYLGH